MRAAWEKPEAKRRRRGRGGRGGFYKKTISTGPGSLNFLVIDFELIFRISLSDAETKELLLPCSQPPGDFPPVYPEALKIPVLLRWFGECLSKVESGGAPGTGAAGAPAPPAGSCPAHTPPPPPP